MTRKRVPSTPKPAIAETQKPVAPAPPAKTRAAQPLAPIDLAALNFGATPPVTSLTLATTHRVDPKHYSPHERAAADKVTLAMDYSSMAGNALSFVSAASWPGFQTLALLAQLPEYRTMHETLADEVVRTWGQITCTSKDEASADKIKVLTEALERFKVRGLIRQAVIHDQAFGGAHIFPRLNKGGADVPLLLNPKLVTPGCLEEFVAVEPVWVTPSAYNASDPTKPNFYKPESWYMLATVVHATRLYTMISRPVSDILKPAYSFRGVSISQLAMPYVDNWLRTRQSVSDTVKQFSITFLKTDMSQMLQPGGAYSLVNRAQLFNLTRDNRNLAVCDMSTEEFSQINTPLAGLPDLQAQAQEQMSAVSHQPLVKAFGITPSGLNASSDGEIRVWYDYVAGYQSHNATPLMLWILQLIQLSELGKIDPGLSWDWNPLYELTDVELAEVREKQARTDQTYLEAGVVLPEMVQQRLQQDPTSGYAGILAEHDKLDDAETLATNMLAQALTPQPQAPNDDPDADQPDAEATPAGRGESVARS